MTSTLPEFKSRTGEYCGRFAPSPSGSLHFGSLVAAFGSFLRARSRHGRWLVRMEDIDTPRVVRGAAQLQLDTLLRFGLEWDGEVLWQSQRIDAYRAALATLQASAHVFECRCTRSELRGEVHRHCVNPRCDGPSAIRLRVPDRDLTFVDAIRGPQTQNLGRDVGDVVLWRSDGLVAYQLAVVVDDAEQAITEVMRGADLLDSTARQIYLQQVLGLAQPAYAHLPLALDQYGHKLGKSQHALALDPSQPLPALRAAWSFLGQHAMVLDECTSVPQLLDAATRGFELERIPPCDRSVSGYLVADSAQHGARA